LPTTEIKEVIPATAAEVFDLLHDYHRRLEWDTLLRKAYLEDDFPAACKGAVSVCQGRALLGGFALRTEYVSFERGKVAAVKLLNQPPFFETFAASIRHRDTGENESEIVYKVNFTAKPKILRWILHPVMNAVFAWETRKRLASLKNFFSQKNLKAR
jgi:ribosome-associated toxin RatA of RatAB toxin-antitoxin module